RQSPNEKCAHTLGLHRASTVHPSRGGVQTARGDAYGARGKKRPRMSPPSAHTIIARAPSAPPVATAGCAPPAASSKSAVVGGCSRFGSGAPARESSRPRTEEPLWKATKKRSPAPATAGRL